MALIRSSLSKKLKLSPIFLHLKLKQIIFISIHFRITMNENIVRCSWLNNDPLYIEYHDMEWGVPEHNRLRLFEMICLEGQQAGLSWITILKKRENYRNLFHGFDPEKISKMTESDVQTLMSTDTGVIVKHKAKIEAIIANAQSLLKMEDNGEEFSRFIWSFVKGSPVRNHWISCKDIPTATAESNLMSKELKSKGFKYVGATICYAFMQACGLVDDHIYNCISRSNVIIKSI